MNPFQTSKYVVQFSLLLVLTLLLTVINPPSSYSYNWPWDQGHDGVASNDGDENWDDDDGEKEPKKCCNEGCGTACSVYVSSGQVNESYTDLTLPGIGPRLQVTRSYNSQDWSSSMFGYGWTFNFGRKLIISRTDEGNKRIGVLLKNGEKNFYKENEDGTLERLTIYGASYQLVNNGDDTYTLIEKNGTTYEIREDGKIAKIIDRNLNELVFSYNSVGCISRVTNASGYYVDFILGPNGKIASIRDNFDRTVSYGYDDDGNLVSVTNPLGHTSQYVYNSENLLNQRIDARGNVIETISYDSHQPPRVATFSERGETFTMAYFDGRTEKTDSKGNKWTYYYNDAGIIERTINPMGYEKRQSPNNITATSMEWVEDLNGNRTTFTYDANGNITSKTDPLGNTTTLTYVAGTNFIESETNPLGVVTRSQYDGKGNLTSLTRDFGGALETTISFVYDNQGRQTSMVDPLGNVTQYEYDTAGNLVKLTNPLGNIYYFTYDEQGNKTSTTDPNGSTVTYAYNLIGQMVSVTNEQGNTTSHFYDGNGNRIKVQFPNGLEVFHEYDTYNRLIKSTDPQGNNHSYLYDHNDNLVRKTDANGHQTLYSYDVLGRRISVTDAKDQKTRYLYDLVGNLTSVVDARGNTTTFVYDSLNRLIKNTYPDGTSYLYGYNELGKMTSQTDPNSNITFYLYDTLNRMIQKQYSDGTTADFTYNKIGRMLTGNNSDASLAYAYNPLGQIVSSTQNGKTVQYKYDAVGNRVSITTPEGEIVQYEYNSSNLMTKMQLSNGKGITYIYDTLGRVVDKEFAGGASATLAYDEVGRLAQLAYKDNVGAIIYNQTNTFDAVGNILKKSTITGDTSFTYDVTYQLTNADHATMSDEHYSYDQVGNRLTSSEHNDWNYDNRNQLKGYNEVNYTYDLNGNTVSKIDTTGMANYSYNAENRMVQASLPTGVNASYKYDIIGRRVEKNVNGLVTKYLYAGRTLIAEYDDSNNLKRNYFYGTSDYNPSMLIEDNQIYFFFKDHLGTPQKIISENGEIAWAAEYKVFGGANITIGNVTNNFRFPGQYWDSETQLHYNLHRYYDGGIGRYLREDPIGFRGGINFFIYARNNAVNGSDPSGLKVCFDNEYYNSCSASAKPRWDNCIDLAEKQFDILMAAIELQYELCKDNCWNDQDINIVLRLACFAACNSVLGIEGSIAASYLSGWIAGCATSYTAQISYCAGAATYTVEDGCGCPR